MLANVELGRDLLEVAEQFLALAEIAAPGVARSEGVGIGVVRRIDAAAGIAIDVPGAAELVVLFDDGVGDAEPAERDAECNGADAGTNDQHMLFAERISGRTFAPACIAWDKCHLLAHQRRVFRRDSLAQRRTHHLQHQLVAGIGDRRLWISVGKQLHDGRADFVLNLSRHARIGIGDQADVALGPVGWLQPALIAGHVHQHHQQHANVALGYGRSEIRCLAVTAGGEEGAAVSAHRRSPLAD